LKFFRENFRKAYGQAANIRSLIECPIVALTGTLIPTSSQMITKRLHLREPRRISTGLNRPELVLNKVKMAAKEVTLLIKEESGGGRERKSEERGKKIRKRNKERLLL